MEDQEEVDINLVLGDAMNTNYPQTTDNQLIAGLIDNLIPTTRQLTHQLITLIHHTVNTALSCESGHKAATVLSPMPDPNFGGSTILLSMFDSPSCDDANMAQLDSLQMLNKVLTQYQVPSGSWFSNFLDNLPFSNLQNANWDSTLAQAYPQGLQVPLASEVPVKNVLLLVETGTFFFSSTSPLPAIPIPMMQPPLFFPTEAQEPCLPGANLLLPGHAPNTASLQTSIPHSTPTPPLLPPTPLLAGGVAPVVLSRPNQPTFMTLAPHAPSLQTVVPHATCTPPFPPPTPPLAAPTVLSSPKQSALSLSHASQPLMSSPNKVPTLLTAPLGTPHTDSPAPSMTLVVHAEKENNHPAVVKGMVNRGRNGRKRKAGEAVQGRYQGEGELPSSHQRCIVYPIYLTISRTEDMPHQRRVQG